MASAKPVGGATVAVSVPFGTLTLEVVHAYGSLASSGIRDPAFAGDEVGRLAIVPVGKQVALRQIESGEVTLLPSKSRVEAVTACTVSDDKLLLAVCEKCLGYPQISIHDLRKEPGSEPIVVLDKIGRGLGRVSCVAFSRGDKQHLSVVLVGKEATVVILDWRSEKILFSQSLGANSGHIDRVRFAPNDSLTLSVSGQRMFRLLRLRLPSKVHDGGLKIMPCFEGLQEATARIVDHAWCLPGDGILVACGGDGPVYIVDARANVVVSIIEVPFQGGMAADVTPTALFCYTQGFLLGGTNSILAVWERTDSGSPNQQAEPEAAAFRHIRTVQVGHSDCAALCSIDLCGSEEVLVLGFRNGNIGTMSSITLLSPVSSLQDQSPAATMIGGGFHGGSIVGLDAALVRPVFATACSKDLSVRFWNHSTRMCELCCRFSRQPAAVALHPFAFLAAVVFQDKIGFFHILVDELKLHSEVFMEGCRSLLYSHGGHFLAAAHGGDVVIVGTRTLDIVAKLHCHDTSETSGMYFDADDRTLLTCSKTGSVIGWSTATWQKVWEHKSHSKELFLPSIGKDSKALCVATFGGRCFLQHLENGKLILEQEVEEKGLRITAICRDDDSSAIFLGTSTGRLWAYADVQALTSQGARMPRPIAELHLHQGPVNNLCLTSAGRTILSCGEDGATFSIAVNSLNTQMDEASRGSKDNFADQRILDAAETVLIERGDLQHRAAELRVLRLENESLASRLIAEGGRLEQECASKLFEARKKDQAEIDELARRCKALDQSTTAKERESKRIIREMELSHLEASQQLKALYEKKLEYEGSRFEELTAERVEMEKLLKHEKEQGSRRSAEETQVFQMRLAQQLEAKDREIQKHRDMVAFTEQRFEDMLDLEAKEHSGKVADTKMVRQQELNHLKQVEAKLRREQEGYLKELEKMTNERIGVERELHEAQSYIAALRLQTEELGRTVNSLKVERKEREITLSDKETKIESYKAKVSKLRKFKTVLDEQLKEVTESLLPKERMLEQLQDNLHELEAEFERQLADQRNIDAQIEQKLLNIIVLNKEHHCLQEVIKARDKRIHRFVEDLHNLITEQTDVKRWPAEVRRMFHVYVCGESDNASRLPLEESQQRMRLLERKVTTLAARTDHMKEQSKTNELRKGREGATLVRDLNELRVHKQDLQSKIKGLQKMLAKLEEERRLAERGNVKLPSLGHSASGELRLGNISPELLPQGFGGPLADEVDYNTRSLEETLSPERPPLAPTTPHMPRSASGSLPGPRQVLAVVDAPKTSIASSMRVGHSSEAHQLGARKAQLAKMQAESKLLQDELIGVHKANRNSVRAC